jgi:hypothetical protein
MSVFMSCCIRIMKRRRVIGTERIMLDNFIDSARERFDEFGKGTNVIIVTLSFTMVLCSGPLELLSAWSQDAAKSRLRSMVRAKLSTLSLAGQRCRYYLLLL